MLKLKNFFPPASHAQIALFEKETGISLPSRYKDFLLNVNGGQPREETIFTIPEIREKVMLGVLFGISNDEDNGVNLITVFKESKEDTPSGFVPIGEDPGGNQLLLSTLGESQGGIFFWDRVGFLARRTGKSMFQIASSIDDFLESLRQTIEK